MTEEEWLEQTEPWRLTYAVLSSGISTRKARLAGVACCRQIWHRLPEGRCRQAVEIAERFADGKAGPEDLAGVRSRLPKPGANVNRWLLDALLHIAAVEFDLNNFIWDIHGWAERQSFQNLGVNSPWRENWSDRLCCLIRDVIGNPFRAVTINSSWVTTNVSAIAHAIYVGRRFEDMPILADALEEAGCMDATFLEHCRANEVHARGCLVVDLILGKS
jgi:hypothetical protein